jgi:uncharacterized protein involved in response to NO
MKDTTEPIRAGSSVRDVLSRYPGAEVVFERHGLLECGGPNGPREPIGLFARVHRVDPTTFVRELNAFVSQREPVEKPAGTRARFATIYPLFLMTSLAIAVLAGFTTGMVALASGALDVPLPGISWPILVQVHGRLQLYGWAGLFVFGVAFHIVPRFVAAPLAWPRLVVATYVLAVVGLALSTAQAVTAASELGLAHVLFVAGLLGVMLAAIGYALVLWWTIRASAQPIELPIRFVVAGALWLVVGAALEAIVGGLSQPGQPIASPAEEPALVAILVGFLVVTALGVSLRTLPVFLGLAPTRHQLLPLIFAAIQVGVLGLVGGDVLAGDLGAAGLGSSVAALGAILVLCSVVVYVVALRLFEPAALPVAEMGTGRGWTRAVRLAYVWLLVGLGLLTEELVRATIRGAPIPWNSLGAAHHALAVGFVTLLIVGMASRVIPVFAGKPLWKAGLVDVATACLVAGAGLRVVVEIVAPYGTSLATGLLLTLSGPLTWAGLLAFTVNFVVTLSRKDGAVMTDATSIDPDWTVEKLLGARPAALDVLVRYGFTPLANPALRKTLAGTITLRAAADSRGIDLTQLLADLSGLIKEDGTTSHQEDTR